MKLHFCFLIFLVPNLFSLKFTRHIPPHHSITDSRNLSGTIPREIVLLKHLTYLDLGTFMLWWCLLWYFQLRLFDWNFYSDFFLFWSTLHRKECFGWLNTTSNQHVTQFVNRVEFMYVQYLVLFCSAVHSNVEVLENVFSIFSYTHPCRFQCYNIYFRE